MRQQSQRRLTIVLMLNLTLIAALVAIGFTAHSLGVLATGLDYLADAAAIAVSLFAITLARRPHGSPNATNIAALINIGWLLALNIGVIIIAISRLATGPGHVNGLPVLIVSAIAALVMLAGTLILGGDPDDDGTEDLNLRAVLLDTAADAAAAAGVVIAGIIIWTAHGWYWLDPAAALIIALVVTYHALALTQRVITAIKATKVVDLPKVPFNQTKGE